MNHLLWNSSPHFPCFLLYFQREKPILSRVLPFGIHPHFGCSDWVSNTPGSLSLTIINFHPGLITRHSLDNHEHWSFSIQSLRSVAFSLIWFQWYHVCWSLTSKLSPPQPMLHTLPARVIIKDCNDAIWAPMPDILNPPVRAPSTLPVLLPAPNTWPNLHSHCKRSSRCWDYYKGKRGDSKQNHHTVWLWKWWKQCFQISTPS